MTALDVLATRARVAAGIAWDVGERGNKTPSQEPDGTSHTRRKDRKTMNFGDAIAALNEGKRVRRGYPTTQEWGPSWADRHRYLVLEGPDGVKNIIQRWDASTDPVPSFRASGPGPNPNAWLVLTPDLLATDWEVCS